MRRLSAQRQRVARFSIAWPLRCAALVFVKDDVEHPVEVVFYAPMTADGVGEFVRVEREAAEVVAPLDAHFPAYVALSR